MNTHGAVCSKLHNMRQSTRPSAIPNDLSSVRSYNLKTYERNASCSVLHPHRSPSAFSGSSASAARNSPRHSRRRWFLLHRTNGLGRGWQARLCFYGQSPCQIWVWWNAKARSRSRNQLGREGKIRGTSREGTATSAGVPRIEGRLYRCRSVRSVNRMRGQTGDRLGKIESVGQSLKY